MRFADNLASPLPDIIRGTQHTAGVAYDENNIIEHTPRLVHLSPLHCNALTFLCHMHCLGGCQTTFTGSKTPPEALAWIWTFATECSNIACNPARLLM
jgi:hypothetical protein